MRAIIGSKVLVALSGIGAVLLLLVASVSLAPQGAIASASEDATLEPPLGARLTNAAFSAALAGQPGEGGDTIYVGYTPGHFNGTNNWWSIWAGSGAGFHRPPQQGGTWDFEPTVGSYLHGDSLQGWWPIRPPYRARGGVTQHDRLRPWWAVDVGNNANAASSNSTGRTFGVVGVWHRDFGAGGGGLANGVTWMPIEGSFSAWMGLRRHGDVQIVDEPALGGTGNPLNEDVLWPNGATSPLGAGESGFPGYGSQMDQMLYRDIDLTGYTNSALTISFSYRLRMSHDIIRGPTRTGWFDKDPLLVAPPNFISSVDAGDAGAPRDSFMVYIGVPAEDTFIASTGQELPIFDPQRRWFGEVIHADEPTFYHELLSAAGSVDLATFSVTIPAPMIAAICAAGSDNRARLIFRVKTNRGSDDEDGGFSSDGAGAAVVDGVSYQIDGGPSSPASWGDFEAASSVDNRISTSATAAWKSTGRPPGTSPHTHAIETLTWVDLCGPPGDPARLCNMAGNVISMGNHDQGEALTDHVSAIVSPTICLAGPFTGPDGTNAIGLRYSDLLALRNSWIDYEVYTGSTDLASTGVGWRYGLQCYPCADRLGQPVWGPVRYPSFFMFNPDAQSFRSSADDKLWTDGLMIWDPTLASNADVAPDSLRLVLEVTKRCADYGVTFGCDPSWGLYFDNVSLAIASSPASPVSIQPWDLYQDTFPANESPGLPGTVAFDTTAAHIKSGHNIAFLTGDQMRPDVPGDSVVVQAQGASRRVDFVFRIFPGPGNYVVPGNVASGLRQVPTSPVAAVPGDNSFWGQYLAYSGEFGTPGGHGASWNVHVWNSARCDTAEMNLFPAGRFASNGLSPGRWMGMYHEADPHFGVLGILKNKCFMQDTSAVLSGSNITCSTVPEWLLAMGSQAGWDGLQQTREYTKILPDGLFTPGTHIEYFFRSSDLGNPAVADLLPDTNTVAPQRGEGSVDGHRWETFSVLPDRWKDPLYGGPGSPRALVVDAFDGRGDELRWVSIADTVGLTAPSKYGAHNGWHKVSGDVNDPAGFVPGNLGQAGTLWDLYEIRASESEGTGSIGSRLASPLSDRASRQGPTPEMLAAYYQLVFILAGSQNSGFLGPFVNRSQDDVGLLQGYLQGSTLGLPRGVWVMGDGFAQSLADRPTGASFLSNYMGLGLHGPNCRDFSITAPLLALGAAVGSPLPAGSWSLGNSCAWTNDVLLPTLALPGACALTQYPDPGTGSYVASVAKPLHEFSPWMTNLDGFGIQHLGPAVTYLSAVNSVVFPQLGFPIPVPPPADLFILPRFYQVDFYGNEVPMITDTDWGDFEITEMPGSDSLGYYLNLVIRMDASSPEHWAIQNMALPAPAGIVDSTRLSRFFDLSPMHPYGGAVPSLQYGLRITRDPLGSQPTALEFATALVSDTRFDACGVGGDESTGPPTDPGPAPQPQPQPVPAQTARIPSRLLVLPDIEEGCFECGPVAITRCLRGLHDYGMIDLGSMSDLQLIQAIKYWGGWTSTFGMGWRQTLEAKLQVTYGLDIVTKFQIPDEAIDGDYTTGAGTALKKGDTPTFQFIKEEWADSEFVEIAVFWLDPVTGDPKQGHMMSVIGCESDPANDRQQVWVQTDMAQGEPGDENARMNATYKDATDGNPPTLEGLPANQVAMVISQSPITPPSLSDGVVSWGGDLSVPESNAGFIAPGKTVTFEWTMGKYVDGQPVLRHPQYGPYKEKNTGSALVLRELKRPNDITITDWHQTVMGPDGTSKTYGGNIEQGSPWSFLPLSQLPTCDWRIPELAPVAGDSTVTIYTAVNLATYMTSNPLGFYGGNWSVGQSLESLEVEIVRGRCAGLEGIYWASSDFTFDPESPTGWVPIDSTAWLNSATYPYSIVIGSEKASVIGLTSVPSVPVAPGKTALYQARPNPSTGTTTVHFALAAPGRVRISVYDLRGRRVRQLADSDWPAGEHALYWNGRDEEGSQVSAGFYFVHLEAGGMSQTRKVLLLGSSSSQKD